MKMNLFILVILLLFACTSVLNSATFVDYIDNFDQLTPAVITDLKTKGEDINVSFKGYSVLQWAVLEASSPQLLRDMIAAGADPKALSYADENLVMLACVNKSPDILDYVLTLGLDVNAVNSDGAGVLVFALNYPDSEVKIAKLLKAGAKPDTKVANGGTPLFLTCRDKKWEAARVLINGGADINTALADGGTPLMYAINAGASAEFVQFMLDKGADASRKTTDGYTAYLIADSYGLYTGTPLMAALAKAAGVTLPANTAASDQYAEEDSGTGETADSADYHAPLPAFKQVRDQAWQSKTNPPTANPPQSNNVSLLSSITYSKPNPNYRLKFAMKGNYLFTSAYRDSLLHIYDVANPAQPKVAGTYNMENLIHGMAVSGNYLYIASLSGLYIVDITQPTAPKLLSCVDSFKLPDDHYTMILVWDVAVVDSTLYASIDEGICTWDITTPTQPQEVYFTRTSGSLNSIYANGGWILGTGYGNTLTAFNSHEGAPFVTGRASGLSDGYAAEMTYYQVFAGTLKGLVHLEMDSQGNLTQKAILDTEEAFTTLNVTDDYLLSVGDKSGLKIYDVSYDGQLTPSGSFPMKGYGGLAVLNRRVYASAGNTIYILDCSKAMPVRPEPDYEDAGE